MGGGGRGGDQAPIRNTTGSKDDFLLASLIVKMTKAWSIMLWKIFTVYFYHKELERLVYLSASCVLKQVHSCTYLVSTAILYPFTS